MNNLSSLVKSISMIVLLIVLGVAVWYLLDWGSDLPRGQAVNLITNTNSSMIDASQKDLANLIGTNFHEYRNNSSRWSFVYFSCIFLAAILSALAGAIIKMDFLKDKFWKNDVAAIFAVTAAILGVISTTGDFQRKWQANRLAASGMENLAYDLLKKPFTDDDRTKVISEIEEINLKRNQEIVGDNKQTDKNNSSQKENNTQKKDNSNTESNKTDNSNKGGNKQENSNSNTNKQENSNANI
jgi:hypothetical protein